MDKPNSETLATSEEMTTLTTLTYQAGIIIDNFEMYQALENSNHRLKEMNERLAQVNEELRIAHVKINNDLDHARVIQTNLLPRGFADSAFMKVGARYIPASTVGGDYYDFFKIDQEHYGLIVADVSGHGVAAAMIMAMTKVLLKTFSPQIISPKQTLEKINSIFQNDIKTDNFVTVFYAILNTNTKQLTYVSAGHNPIIYMDKKTKEYELIKAEGLFLGVFEDMLLQDRSRITKSGDRIVLYTDGLTEAENKSGEMYSMERLCDISQKLSHLKPDEFLDQVLKDLKSYTQNKTLEDDVTMMVIDF
jgi:sigma-B regulation protein RsbU (phosphoserine phosphatase)